ncbi:MAG: LD-carboxypeptidase [Butyrivibrio sp.]|nr:LD-carboxypeptidase [Butyrivibrio sp.]
MRYPKPLEQNGTIGFVAPSFGCATEPYKSAFDKALENFDKMGYKTVLGPNCRLDKGIGISNKPKACGDELNSAYLSDESDVIISCGGGELMCEVVPYIDFEAVSKANPKWYMGFSDNTNFTFLSATLSDTAAIYGPCAATFGMNKWHESLYDCFKLLTGELDSVHNYDLWEKEGLRDEEHPFEPYNLTEKMEIKYYIPGENKESEDFTIRSAEEVKNPVAFEGRLLGGCMDCLQVLCGTEFDKVKEFCEKYKEDGIIFFLEACDLNVMSIRRVLWQMKNSGWFSYVKGFLIGRPMHFDEGFLGLDQYHAVVDILAEYNVPVIMDLDIGHLPPQMPIVTGAVAEVNCHGNNFNMKYKFK